MAARGHTQLTLSSLWRVQGPVDCSKGSGSVPFKNVFAADADFVFSLDNPAFQVRNLAWLQATQDRR
jgi:hypothetical protein